MTDFLTPVLNLGLLGLLWVAAGVGTGIYAMGVWQNFQEEEFGLPVSDLGHKWFFMACACPPASLLTTKLFFPNVKFRPPRWTRN